MAGENAVRVRRERAPKPVGLAALGLGGDSGTVKVTDAYTGGAKLLFNVPKYAGMGAHWSLDDDEADDLGQAIAAFVKTLPKSQRAKWEKKLAKYWPGINLMVVAGMITVPRVMATVELAKMKRTANTPQPEPSTPYGQASNAGTRPASVDLRDLVERVQNAPSETSAPVSSGGVGEDGRDDGTASA